MKYAAIDEELATMFAVLWQRTLVHLPLSERLPAAMAHIRAALAREERTDQEAHAAMRSNGRTVLAVATRVSREQREAVERVAASGRATAADLAGPSKCAEVCALRHRAIWVLHRKLGASKTVAGLAVNRSRQRAIASIAIVDNLIAADPGLRESLDRLAAGDERGRLRIVSGRAA